MAEPSPCRGAEVGYAFAAHHEGERCDCEVHSSAFLGLSWSRPRTGSSSVYTRPVSAFLGTS